MATGTLEIHSENILPIIKKWLYSDHDIFVRELVSNACDALSKLKVLEDIEDKELRIDIRIDKDKKTLSFIDTGIGMDAEEVKKYIAQIAFSGAEEFLKHYETKSDKDMFIGHFGLGFYSAYMVADKVEIQTQSYKQGSEPVFWSCEGSSDYEIDPGSRETRGTEVILSINAENEEFLDETKVRAILKKYCSYLPYPIYLNDSQVNAKPPLWIKPATECEDKEYKEFYKELYPLEEEPHFWVHLNVDYPFHLKGLLYFPKFKPNFDFSKSYVKLFCNRVFVSEDCKDVLPDFLTMLKGVIDCPDIPLNVSRSQLQADRTVRQLGTHISKKIADSLNQLFKDDKESFLSAWKDVETIVKLGAMQDDKFFDRVKDLIVWKNAEGDWISIDQYLAENSTEGKVYYAEENRGSKHIIDAYKKKGIDVLLSKGPIDAPFMAHLERKLENTTFERIDSSVADSLIDKEREMTVLDQEGKTKAARIEEAMRSMLDDETLSVEAKSLASDELPGFLVIGEQERRMRDYMAMSDLGQSMPTKKSLVVNTNHPLVNTIFELKGKDPELAKQMSQHLLHLILFSQNELKVEELHDLVQGSFNVLTKLSEKIGE